MKKYEDFELEDFLSDEPFKTWVLIPGSEQNEFWDAWLAANPRRREVVDRARNILLSLQPVPAIEPLTQDEVAEITLNVKRRTTGMQQRPLVVQLINTTWIRVAAVLLIVLTSALLLFRNDTGKTPVIADKQQVQVIHYVNKRQRTEMIRLSDGSLVFLKPQSKLQYSSRFTGANREVTLVGEAFFEVQKNAKQPFLVYSKNMITKVLGTSFTVRAYPGEEKSKVVVNTGRVQVFNKDNDQKIVSSVVLAPNEAVTLAPTHEKLKKEIVPVPLVLSQDVALRVFAFDNAPLSEIISKLENAYNVTINYDSQRFKDATVTASLGKLPLDEKIKMICKAIDAEYDFNNGIITIK